MKRSFFAVALVLIVAMLLPSLAAASPKVTDTQTYTWGGFTATTYGSHVSQQFDSSLHVYKSKATVFQLTPADWSSWYGWRAERILLMGDGCTISWRGVKAPADEVLQNPAFLYWAYCGGGASSTFVAEMVQDKFDPQSYEVTEVIFPYSAPTGKVKSR